MGGIYLKLDGLDGDSRDPAHPGWVEIESFSWKTKAVSVRDGANKPNGGNPKEFVVSMRHSGLAPKLMQSAAEGREIAWAAADFVGGTSGETYRFRFTGVMVTSWQSSSSYGSTVPIDTASFVANDVAYFPVSTVSEIAGMVGAVGTTAEAVLRKVLSFGGTGHPKPRTP